MELFIAKYMQVYKYLFDADSLETRVNFRKALSPSFLENFGATTDHILPANLEDCFEKARFAATVIKARRPTIDKIPNHSAQLATNKPVSNKPNDRTPKPFRKKYTASQPNERRVVHSSCDNIAKSA